MPTKTCFLIDDDADDQEIFELAVNSLDPSITCVFANDGDEGLQKLLKENSFTPDLIFLDLNMPRMGGKECLQGIRKIDRLSGVPVIIYSTSTEQKDKLETKALGADLYLEKQTSLTALKDRLTDIFNR